SAAAASPHPEPSGPATTPGSPRVPGQPEGAPRRREGRAVGGGGRSACAWRLLPGKRSACPPAGARRGFLLELSADLPLGRRADRPDRPAKVEDHGANRARRAQFIRIQPKESP